MMLILGCLDPQGNSPSWKGYLRAGMKFHMPLRASARDRDDTGLAICQVPYVVLFGLFSLLLKTSVFLCVCVESMNIKISVYIYIYIFFFLYCYVYIDI